MARSRNLKPGFFLNEMLVELDFWIRLLFAGLWCIADRSGRLENRPKKIKMQLFPADDVDIPEALLMLAEKKLVILYTIDSIDYIEICNFTKHQHPHHKEADSVIPKPPLPSKAQDKPKSDPSDSFNPITTDTLDLIPDKSAEQKDCSAQVDEVQIQFILNDKSFYPITKKQCTEWATLFPAVDVPQALRSMKAWLDANPKKRKTKNGVLRFVTAWLGREQDKGKTNIPDKHNNFSERDYEADATPINDISWVN